MPNIIRNCTITGVDSAYGIVISGTVTASVSDDAAAQSPDDPVASAPGFANRFAKLS